MKANNFFHRIFASVYRWFFSKISYAIEYAKFVKKVLQFICRSEIRYFLWILNYFEILGSYKSYKYKLPIDRHKRPLPWYTYAAIEYLEQYDFSKCNIFEYGSGHSSKFWSERSCMVISVESDQFWFKYWDEKLGNNHKFFFKTEMQGYVNTIYYDALLYDVIVIDGKYRYNCAKEAIKCIKDGGIIILDNTDWFPNTAKLLRDNGFIQVDFIGAGPINSYPWCTSIFFKNKINIPRKRHEIKVQGGLIKNSDDDFCLPYKEESSRKSFALNQLDMKMAIYLNNRTNGFFVEVGANDGLNQSNTLYFEKYLAWRGLLIEGVPELAERCKKNRPNCIVENCALVASDYKEKTIEMIYCNLMSIVKGSMGKPYEDSNHIKAGKKFLKKREKTYHIEVPAKTLSYVLDSYRIDHVDLLSLDVEGYEAQVLKGIDFTRHRPEFILIEVRDREEIESILAKRYEAIAILSINKNYSDILYKLKK
ncbi:MAG: FkbM family methyltransferase [Spirochaetes bacterium]|nr:FkbM family methyltransferase [Spirochaetota bacterium]